MRDVVKVRVYADTSVFGGCFDAEFKTVSEQFFREVRAGRFVLVVSDLTVEELADAPERVRNVLRELASDQVEQVRTTPECEALQRAYLEAGVIGAASADDALHIAIAAVLKVELVVSWNFKQSFTSTKSPASRK